MCRYNRNQDFERKMCDTLKIRISPDFNIEHILFIILVITNVTLLSRPFFKKNIYNNISFQNHLRYQTSNWTSTFCTHTQKSFPVSVMPNNQSVTIRILLLVITIAMLLNRSLIFNNISFQNNLDLKFKMLVINCSSLLKVFINNIWM